MNKLKKKKELRHLHIFFPTILLIHLPIIFLQMIVIKKHFKHHSDLKMDLLVCTSSLEE